MEPQRGEEQLARRAGGGVNDDAGAAACLCPAAIAGAARGSLFPPRHALEQEVLRRAELQLHVGGGGGDRRRERKMKNRESAARSRARSHAYVSELEKEVSLLQAENDELRKLCDEVTFSCLKRSNSKASCI
jgi:hypothetical protein